MSDNYPVLVALYDEGSIRLIGYWNRTDAEADIEELDALLDGGHTMAHVSAEIVSPSERFGPLVDEFDHGAQLGNRLEKIGYHRAHGLWFRLPNDYELGMTLPNAITDAKARGLWED